MAADAGRKPTATKASDSGTPPLLPSRSVPSLFFLEILSPVDHVRTRVREGIGREELAISFRPPPEQGARRSRPAGLARTPRVARVITNNI